MIEINVLRDLTIDRSRDYMIEINVLRDLTIDRSGI